MAATASCRRAVLSTLRPDMAPIAVLSASAAMAPMITEAMTAPEPALKNQGNRGRTGYNRPNGTLGRLRTELGRRGIRLRLRAAWRYILWGQTGPARRVGRAPGYPGCVTFARAMFRPPHNGRREPRRHHRHRPGRGRRVLADP